MNAAVARWRWPVLMVVGIIAAGVLIAALQPTAPGYLDPGDTSAQGGHALADLLSARGQQVLRAGSVTDAVADARGGGDLLLVTDPRFLTGQQLSQLAAAPGDVLLTDPDAAALNALAPAVQLAGTGPEDTIQPGCAAQPARLAGDAALGGTLLRTTSTAALECYPNWGGYSLIIYAVHGREITVLGNSAPLTNGNLASDGNAALALNLLRDQPRVIWLVPSASNAVPVAPPSGQRSFLSLVPLPAYLVALQLFLAVLLAAGWRARRLGQVVSERLPVVVRASETVEGHGRLYQSHHARDRAGEAFRAATRTRLAAALGTRAGIAEVVAARTGRQPEVVRDLLYGAAPRTDAELVRLASELDTLEREVRQP
jgi:hypothetical protein